MIIVNYTYRIKADEWRRNYKEFEELEKAIRFIWSIKRKKDAFVTSYECDDPEENEVIDRRVGCLF